MSLHRDIVNRMVTGLIERYPGCGILVGGSVQRGEERPDSDLDLFVVFAGGGHVHLEHEQSAEGVKIDLALFPEAAFLRDVETQWYKFWMFARAEIVHDPSGIAGRCQKTALTYFRRHPQIDRAWEQQLAEVRLHKADRSYQLTYWTWNDFISHIETLLAPN
jgi:predicted nucleotidyltransferase